MSRAPPQLDDVLNNNDDFIISIQFHYVKLLLSLLLLFCIIHREIKMKNKPHKQKLQHKPHKYNTKLHYTIQE